MKKKLLIILPVAVVCIVGIVLAIIFLSSSDKSPVADNTKTDTKTSQKDTPSEITVNSTEKSTQKSTSAKKKKATEKSTQNGTEKTTQKSTQKSTQKPTQKSTASRATSPKSTAVPTEKPTTKKTSAPTSPSTTVPTDAETSPLVPTEAETVPPETDDQNLVDFLNNTDYSFQTLDDVDCQQVITVSSHDTNLATVSLFEKNENGLWKNSGLDTDGFVGSNGVSAESYEGSYQTPYGMYSVGEAFYIDDKPSTGLDIFRVTDKTYWVDDPQSDYYNQKVEGFVINGWNSAEHMIEYYPDYRYGFVINFNMGENKVSDNGVGKGSAIFFHISYSPTAGCVGVSEDMMVAYLNTLDKTKNPYIIIV